MSATPRFRASDVAAQQVEQIVAAAQQAAEEMRREAKQERQEARRRAKAEGDEIRAQAHQDAEEEMNRARKEAIMLGQDARRDSELILNDAREEAVRLREQTKRTVEGRVAAAEKAAADVLAEARALSGGLRQLGRALEDHAERILRDVQAAHKRMQADLRVGHGLDVEPAEGERAPLRVREPSVLDDRPTPSRARRNPFEDLEVPGWERRDR